MVLYRVLCKVASPFQFVTMVTHTQTQAHTLKPAFQCIWEVS